MSDHVARLAPRPPVAPTIYDEWLPDMAVCAVLDINEVTLKKSRQSGILFGKKAPRFYKFGRLVRYRYSELIAWLETFPQYTVTPGNGKQNETGEAA